MYWVDKAAWRLTGPSLSAIPPKTETGVLNTDSQATSQGEVQRGSRMIAYDNPGRVPEPTEKCESEPDLGCQLDDL